MNGNLYRIFELKDEALKRALPLKYAHARARIWDKIKNEFSI